MNSTRIRTGLILVLILGSILAAIYLLSRSILGNSYLALEHHDAKENVHRAIDALDYTLEQLNSKAGDWANWDDSYDFVRSPTEEFIRTNINDVSFQQLKINFIIFLDPSGKIVVARAFDLKKKESVPLSASFARLLKDKKSLGIILRSSAASQGLTGSVLTQENPVLIAARPILTSEAKGPVRGTLIFAEYLDDAAIERLSATTHLALAAKRLDQLTPSDEFYDDVPSISTSNPIYIHSFDEEFLHGYGLITDIFGNPSFVLQAMIGRDIYQEGQATVRYFMLVSSLIGIILAGITWVLLDRVVLSHQFQRETETRYRSVIERAAEAIVLIDAQTTRILEANPAFLKIFGYSANEISNLNLQDLVADSGNAAVPETLGFRLLVGERRYQCKDGTQLDVEGNASVISQNSHRVVSVIIRDMTARKRAQREIQQKAQQFSLLYDAGIALNSQLEPEKTIEHL